MKKDLLRGIDEATRYEWSQIEYNQMAKRPYEKPPTSKEIEEYHRRQKWLQALEDNLEFERFCMRVEEEEYEARKNSPWL